MRALWLLALCLLALGVTASGCVQIHRTVGDQCDVSTDCAAPLACRLGRCRNGCAASRDCDLGTTCALDNRDLGSCLIPEETRCALDSECPEPLVCRMGRCANTCVEDRDCVDGARCQDVEGALTCVDEAERRCVDETDCEAPRVCGPFNLCAIECVEDRDCRDGVCLANRCSGADVCDADGDCDDGDFCNGAERCDAADPSADARGCAPEPDGPCAPGELCDPSIQACAPRCDVDADLDDDGQDAAECGGTDCDDSSAEIRMGADERCNGVDDDCDEMSDEGFSLETDPLHCGACDNACSAAGGTATCVGGSCGVSCAAGFDDCDAEAHNGCEVELGSDALHCGECDDVCPLGQACVASTCTPSPFVEVAAGGSHSCARRSSGGVVCWGDNSEGQLGDGTNTSSSAPVAVNGLVDAIAIAAAGDATCAIRANGRVWCWGDNRGGQLGDGTTVSRSRPVMALAPPGVVEVGMGRVHSCGLTAGGVVACWGLNTSGQLGADVDSAGSARAVQLRGLTGAAGLAVGRSATCVTRAAQPMVCVGRLANQPIRAEPTEVAGTTGLSAEAGLSVGHACGALGDELRCWGRYTPSANAALPEAPMGASGLTFVRAASGELLGTAISNRFACAQQTSGRVSCIGAHSLGQLGDGSSIHPTTPASSESLVEVTGLGDAVDLAVGAAHACAARATGGVVCWGRNDAGQLGNDATTVDQIEAEPYTLAGESSPVDVVGLP